MTFRLEDLPTPERGLGLKRERTEHISPAINRKALTRLYVRLQRSHALIEALKDSNDLDRYSKVVHRWWYPAAQSFYAACAALHLGSGGPTSNGFVPVGRSAQDWAEDYRRAWALAEAER